MLPGFAGEFAIKTHSFREGLCSPGRQTVREPVPSPSLLWWRQAQVFPRVYLALIREPRDAGSTKPKRWELDDQKKLTLAEWIIYKGYRSLFF